MEVTLPADLGRQVEQELAERQRGQRRLETLRSIGQAVDEAGLCERVPIPDPE